MKRRECDHGYRNDRYTGGFLDCGERRPAVGLRKWLYRGGRPNWIARLADWFTAALSARRVGPDYLVTLEVPGRKSGQTVTLPLVVADVEGERYLVSMLGEGIKWVRNVRAAEGEAVLRHGRREEVHPKEVAPERHAPVLKAYLGRAPNARVHIPWTRTRRSKSSRRWRAGSPCSGSRRGPRRESIRQDRPLEG